MIATDIGLDEAEAVRDTRRKHAKKEEEAPGIEQAPPLPPPALPPAPIAPSSAGSGSALAPAPPPPRPVLPPIADRLYNAVEARDLIPKAKGCTLSIHEPRQWEVKYRQKASYPRSKSITWDGVEGYTRMQALRMVLRWAWDAHFERCGEACPYDLDEVAVA